MTKRVKEAVSRFALAREVYLYALGEGDDAVHERRAMDKAKAHLAHLVGGEEAAYDFLRAHLRGIL